MADLETLKALRERVLAAKGPDRELDRAVLDAITPAAQPDPDGSMWVGGQLGQMVRDARIAAAPIYTASIDAALALVERMLPGWDYGFDLFHDEGRAALTHSAYVGSPANEEREHHSFPRRAASLPLALLLALIDALIAQQEQGA